MDESVPFKVVLWMWVYALAGTLVVALFYVIAVLFGELVTSGSLGFTGPLVLGIIIATVVFWMLFLFSKSHEPIAEWKTLLESKAEASTSAYAAIFGSLARRKIPVRWKATRIRSDLLPDVVNNRLVITERSYIVYVSVFAYGTSLYVGWMMWRSRRGATLVGTFIKDIVSKILLRTSIVKQMLRTEKVRAMREAVHSAVREGVDTAIDGIEVSIISTFGYDISIQGRGGSASVLPPTPPPGGWSAEPPPPLPQPNGATATAPVPSPPMVPVPRTQGESISPQ